MPQGPPPASKRARSKMELGAILDGRYVIGSFLGEGAMATVYEAEDLHAAEPIAVKILNRKVTGGKAQMVQEAKIATMIGHPNIVRVLDIGERRDKRPYLIMELLRGETLGAFLRREETMPVDMAVTLLARIASALVAAHAAGVVHRDLKPDNIFLLGSPPNDVKLLDFGLAKVEHHSLISRSGIAVGTMAYMAPEQVLAEPVDGRTDVYGLGVVLFRAITGHLPFEGHEEIDVLAHQLLSQAPPASWLRENLSPDVDAVIAAALRKHPANRYPSMAAMLSDLEKLTRGEEVQVPKVSREPDRYDPTTEEARTAASIFYARAGLSPPVW